MRVPVHQGVADLLEDNNINRFRARKAQAVRRRGVGQKTGTSGNQHRVVGRSSRNDVHTSLRPRVKGAGAMRAADPTPRLFVSVLALLGVGLFCVVYVIARAITGGI